ncbi:MAG: segregation and condensation protein A [Fusicatenibacter sp.]|nr:segregation/condensation protein A [Fusicatenibacter sp.]
MAIPVKLPVFEGPLDLLLHLIDKNKIDIYDIPIVEITDQYLDYIHQMEKEDLDVMSEFMVMAATLLDIKCKMLLPKEINEEGEEEDPRAELVQQLLEYKMYKYMSYELRDRMNEASRSVYKEATLPREVLEYRVPVDTSELLKNVSLDKLYGVYKSILKRQEDKIDPIRSKFGKIEKEEVSLPEKMTFVERYAVEKRKFSFESLLEAQASKVQVIVTFLAILELMKMGKIRICQEKLFGEIEIESLEKEGTYVVPYSEKEDSEGEDDDGTTEEK